MQTKFHLLRADALFLTVFEEISPSSHQFKCMVSSLRLFNCAFTARGCEYTPLIQVSNKYSHNWGVCQTWETIHVRAAEEEPGPSATVIGWPEFRCSVTTHGATLPPRQVWIQAVSPKPLCHRTECLHVLKLCADIVSCRHCKGKNVFAKLNPWGMARVSSLLVFIDFPAAEQRSYSSVGEKSPKVALLTGIEFPFF